MIVKNGRSSQGSGDKADEISDNATSEGKDNSVPGAGIDEEEVFDLCLAFSRFYRLSGRDSVGEESRLGVGESGAEFRVESGKIETGDIGVGDKDVGGGWESFEDCLDNIWHEMESTVDGLLAEDGDLLYVDHGGLGEKTGEG